MDSQWTAVKIRGKRRATAPEKWRTDKRRTAILQKRLLSAEQKVVSTPADCTSRPRKRRRRATQAEMPLERLPTEVLQQIFELSANVDLPLVSRRLGAKLSKSQHLQQQLTSELLSPILGQSCGDVTERDLAAATRLLSSRFVTLPFFESWLCNRAVKFEAADRTEGIPSLRLWSALQPSPRLLPPRKLLSPPFTAEKIDFLDMLSFQIHDIAAMNPACGELAHESLLAAIQQHERRFVARFLSMGLGTNTELLQVAVTEAGCDKEIVQMLVAGTDRIGRVAQVCGQNCDVDLLDPVLWSWAERARKRGDEKGEWLLALLRETQQDKGHSLAI